MNAGGNDENPHAEGTADISREIWLLMSDLVLDHERRREVSDAVGLSFSRARAVRRVARQPMSMGELAAALGIDRPNATVLVDDLEAQGLVRRRAHPTDRRTRLVEPTRKGKNLARRANEILGTPPAAFSEVGREDLETLRRILQAVRPPK
jgi:DNA-binding MarR family transcriptional regulator